MGNKVTKDMTMGEILRQYPESASTLLESGMHCLGCPSAQMESLQDACTVHNLDADAIVNKINTALGL